MGVPGDKKKKNWKEVKKQTFKGAGDHWFFGWGETVHLKTEKRKPARERWNFRKLGETSRKAER